MNRIHFSTGYLKIVAFCCVFFMVSCTEYQEKAESILIDNSKISDSVIIDSLISSIEVIPLKKESTKSLLSDISSKIFFYKNRIIIVDYILGNYVCIFNNDGEFISKIEVTGQGPGELSDISSVSINPSEDCLEIFSGNEKKELIYSLDGKFLEEKPSPVYFQDKVVFKKHEIFYSKDLANLSFFGNGNCYELFSMDKIKGKLNLLKSKDQEDFRKFVDSRTNNPFFKFEENLFFYKFFTDTIFNLSEKELKIRYVIKFQERGIPSNFWKKNSRYSEKIEALEKERLAYFSGRFFESVRFVSLVYGYQGNSVWYIRDKKNSKQINSLSIRLEKYDLDLFPPLQFSENGFFYFIPAKAFKRLINGHSNPSILPYRFREIADSLNESDNPVILRINLLNK